MSLIYPNRHTSMMPNVIADDDADDIVNMIRNHYTTIFGTVDEAALLSALRRFRLSDGGTLSDFFLFNDQQEAAKRYRLSRLRKLLAAIHVDYKDAKDRIGNTKAFYRVTTVGGVVGSHGYVHVRHILGNPELEAQVLARLAVNSATWQNYFSQMRSMSNLIKRCKRVGKWKPCPPLITYKPPDAEDNPKGKGAA